MKKQLTKLCLASILSLLLNTNLQAQELNQPYFCTQEEEKDITENISEAINSFIQEAEEARPEIGIQFSNEDMEIAMYRNWRKHDTENPEQGFNEVLSVMSEQDWCSAVKIVRLRLKAENDILASALSQMPNLESLLLLAGIESEGFDTLFSALTELPNLHTLKIRSETTVFSNVEELLTLAAALANMPNLQTLELSFKGTDDSVMVNFAEAISQIEGFALPNLQTLNLSDESLKALNENGVQALATFLSFMPNLQELDLGNNELGERLMLLAPAIATMNNLQSLNLYKNKIDESVMVDFANVLFATEGFEEFTGLCELNLGGNKIGTMGTEGWEALTALLSSCTLSKLILDSTELCKISENGLEALANILWNQSNLNVLDLEDSRLGGRLLALAPAIVGMHNLNSLNLSACSINESVMIHFVNTFKAAMEAGEFTGMHNLQSLDFEENDLEGMSPQGWAALCEFLLYAPHLQNLSLRDGDLQIGLPLLAPALASLTELQTLNLKNSILTEEALVNFIDALSHISGFEGFPALEELNLFQSLPEEFGPDGYQALMTFLFLSPNLNLVNLGQNFFEDAETHFIDALLQTPSIAGIPNLTHLNLDNSDSESPETNRTLTMLFEEDDSDDPELEEALSAFNPNIVLEF